MTQIVLEDKLKDRTQHQIQTLIQGNDIAKSEIRRHRLEAQKVVQESVRPRPHEVIQESERLHDSIMKDMKYFSSVCLPAVPKIYMDGVNLGPVQELSINRLSSPLSPYYPIYRGIYGSICLPPFKAPETALLQVSDIKKRLRFLRSQLSSRRQTIARLQRPLCETTDLDTLLQLLSGHYTQQMEQLVPKLQLLIQQCQQSQEYGKEVQAAVSDWWEQPAQMCLPQEERGGQTLRQWQDRWTVAVTALQRGDGRSQLRTGATAWTRSHNVTTPQLWTRLGTFQFTDSKQRRRVSWNGGMMLHFYL
ncbi:LOW QUALITY PROTEIN: HAUS augmin-like complex subunit 5 [Anomaloglossus baeobatrachus]